jgi:hypothetical protein
VLAITPRFFGFCGFSLPDFTPRSIGGMRLDKLARHFTATYDVKVKKEIERLAAEYGKLKEPWRFVAR